MSRNPIENNLYCGYLSNVSVEYEKHGRKSVRDDLIPFRVQSTYPMWKLADLNKIMLMTGTNVSENGIPVLLIS